jgi:hypothetical protein
MSFFTIKGDSMTWVLIADAVERGLGTRASLHRHAQQGKIPSYKNSEGSVLIWIGESLDAELALRLMGLVERLQEQVEALTAKNISSKVPARSSRSKKAPKKKEPTTSAPLLPDVELVAAIEKSGLSMNKIEKAAGVWSGAISKLKRGQLPPGHQKPRRLLLDYLAAA